MPAAPTDLFAGIVPFVTTADARSFRVAAKRLGVTASTVSKAIAKLEADLGVRLLHRTSRSVSLTVEGELFLQRCRTAVDDVTTARALLSDTDPRGPLRISLPHRLARHVMGELPSFLEAHPQISVHATVTDRFVQLHGETVDVALRIGELADSSCVARRLRSLRLVTVASRGYLAAHGTPRSPDELARHNCLKFLLDSGIAQPWLFRTGGVSAPIAVDGNLTVDHGESLIAAALGDLGLLQAPDIMIADELARGTLVEVLGKHTASAPPLTAVCLATSHRTPKVRAYVAMLARLFAKRG
ncbi:MAG: LysR family transcriptional regulator [Acidobacteriota bacterium]